MRVEFFGVEVDVGVKVGVDVEFKVKYVAYIDPDFETDANVEFDYYADTYTDDIDAD